MDDMDVDLAEHSESPPVRLPRAARKSLMSVAQGRVDIRATADPDRVVLVTGSWVGAISVPGLTVRIRPSAPMENLFTMFSAGIPGEGWGSDQIGWSSDADLVDGVAAFVLRSIDEATRRGLLHGYVTVEEDLNLIRGRLLVEKLATRPWQIAEPPCRYDDFTANIPENQLLRCAVRQVLTWPSLPPVVRRDGLRMLARFDGVADTDPGTHRDRIPITRLNEHYGPAMDLARMALDGVAIRHMEGEQSAHTFLVDMDDLFRRWVTVELSQRLWPEIAVDEQPEHSLDVHDQLQFTPDMLLRSGPRAVLVGDVVYHLGSTSSGPSTDYFPLLTYASALGLGAGMLVYAQADEPPAPEMVVRSIGTRLISVPLRLSVPPARLAGSLDTLAELVRAVAVGALAPAR